MASQYHYTVFGLGIQSELYLPELEPGSIPVEVNVRFGPIPRASTAAGVPHQARASGNKAILYWNQVGSFLIRNGCEIIVDPDPGAAAERVRLFLLGAAMGVLLHQRGLIVLHGSGVAIDGEAVAFLGGNGWGKSTMAAALHSLGHHFVADDVLAVDAADDLPTVLPGFPQLKLWPDAIASIGQAAETLPRLHPELEKRDYHLTARFSKSAMSLNRIYLLDHGPKPTIEPVHAAQALVELLPHWYCARFSPQVLQSLGQHTHFLQCTTLARRVPIYRLKRPRSLAALFDVARLVQAHCPVEAMTALALES